MTVAPASARPAPAGPTTLDRATAGGGTRVWRREPAEIDRLLWDDRVHPTVARQHDALASPKFTTLGDGQPTRWPGTDLGQPIVVHVRPDGNPLGSDEAAVNEIERALEAWNTVGESRVRLELGDTALPYVELYATSPVDAYSGTNIVLFDDPYGDIADPIDCAGVLAIGGYWRASGTGSTVNGIAFHTALQLYVVFNDGFECFLADPDNLAEIAAHEIGHGLGFGHSPAEDSIMRAAAYSGRGPRLGDDDRDAAHCHYPHALTVTAPTAGSSSIAAGEPLTLRWTPTLDSGQPGTVDAHASLDDGATWIPIALATTNDGALDWTVPPDATGALRLRLSRARRGSTAPAGYPARCTVALSESLELDATAQPRTAADVAATRGASRLSSRRPSPPARGTEHAAGRAPSSSP